MNKRLLKVYKECKICNTQIIGRGSSSKFCLDHIPTQKNLMDNWRSSREKDFTTIRRQMMHRTKSRSKIVGVPFNLDINDFETPEYCPILGIKLEYGLTGKNTRSDFVPSIDRIIPELGYVKGNIKTISFKANRLKSNATLEEVEAIAKYIRDEITKVL